VKVCLVEQHLVSKKFPYRNERSLTVQLNGMIPEWVVGTIVGADRHREANPKRESDYESDDSHVH
jgi:hypothetical protein